MIETKEYFKVLSQYKYSPLNLIEGYETVDGLLLYIFRAVGQKFGPMTQKIYLSQKYV